MFVLTYTEIADIETSYFYVIATSNDKTILENKIAELFKQSEINLVKASWELEKYVFWLRNGRIGNEPIMNHYPIYNQDPNKGSFNIEEVEHLDDN